MPDEKEIQEMIDSYTPDEGELVAELLEMDDDELDTNS